MFNKRQFLKANTKKVLHKVRKQWIVVSLALLMMIGGGAVATHVTHADVNMNNQNTPQKVVNTPQQLQLDSKLSKNDLLNKNSQQQTNAIQNKANELHSRIINNTLCNNKKIIRLGSSGDESENLVDLPSGNSSYDGYGWHIFRPPTGYGNYELDITNGGTDSKDTPSKPLYKIFTKSSLNKIAYIRISHSNYNWEPLSEMCSDLFAHLNGLQKFSDTINAGTANETNMSHVKTMKGMFANDPKLQTIYLTNALNTDSVSDISSMFANDPKLQTIRFGNSQNNTLNLSNFNTANVTNMSDMFSGDSNLQTLNLSNFNTANVTDMNRMFSGDSNLQTLNLSNFNTANVTNMSDMFSDDSNLRTLNLSSFYTPKLLGAPRMFLNDIRLHSIRLDNFGTPKIMNMNSMFLHTGLDSLKLPSGFGINMSDNSIDMSDMFANNPYLSDIVLDLGFGKIKNTSKSVSMSQMFSQDSKLNNIQNISDINTSDVNNMNAMFYGTDLKSLNLGGINSHFNTSKVTNMYKMFSGNPNLSKVILGPNFNTSNVTDMSDMFASDGQLTSLDLGRKFIFNLNNNSKFNTMFNNCNKLSQIKYYPNPYPTNDSTYKNIRQIANDFTWPLANEIQYTSSDETWLLQPLGNLSDEDVKSNPIIIIFYLLDTNRLTQGQHGLEPTYIPLKLDLNSSTPYTSSDNEFPLNLSHLPKNWKHPKYYQIVNSDDVKNISNLDILKNNKDIVESKGGTYYMRMSLLGKNSIHNYNTNVPVLTLHSNAKSITKQVKYNGKIIALPYVKYVPFKPIPRVYHSSIPTAYYLPAASQDVYKMPVQAKQTRRRVTRHHRGQHKVVRRHHRK